MRSFRFLCALGLVPALASTAFAHAVLMSPQPRSTNDAIKTGPCGGDPQVAPLEGNTFEAGSELNVAWLETVDHPGHYRVSFSPDGRNVFDEPGSILMDMIPDEQNGATRNNPTTYMAPVTLPDMECDSCVLQVTQYMAESRTYYYTCADIKLVRAAAAPPGPELPADGPLPGVDPTSPEASSSSELGAQPGFCSVAADHRGSPPAALALLAALGFLARRRRLATARCRP